jgi:hypothetical protein
VFSALDTRRLARYTPTWVTNPLPGYIGNLDAVATCIAAALSAQEEMRRHELAHEEARARRDAAIRTASRLGVTRRALASSMDMTPGRVQQIVGENKPTKERTVAVRPKTIEQIANAYKKMASAARYRPQAPSDGFGGITVPLKDLDLDVEAEEYAIRWNDEEDSGQFYIGLCNFPTRPATIFAVEAARNMCGGMADELALKLLRLAADDLEEQIKARGY